VSTASVKSNEIEEKYSLLPFIVYIGPICGRWQIIFRKEANGN